ncbi:putative ATP-dependent DNA helicase HFM1 isoform 2-T5 [Spinachia spinachia]
MLDTDDCTLSLDELFFEKPIVHKVKPLHQEVSRWQLDVPLSLSQVPATQKVQKEAESFSTLYSFSQVLNTFMPPWKGSDSLMVLPSKINSTDPYNNDEREIEQTQSGGNSTSTSLWGGDGFRDYSQGCCQSGRSRDENLQHSGHPVSSRRCLALEQSQSPPLRKSLFKVQNIDDLRSSSSCSQTQTASRPQTFLSAVAMVTVPPLQPPRATVSQAASLLSPKPPFPPPPLGSSAARGRLPHTTANAEMQDNGTKRAFVPPMTPQPLCIRGSSRLGVLRPVSEIPAKFRSVFKEFPFFNYVQSKALDDVLYTSKNFVACAPTGSGKTVLFELAIIRLLMESSEPWKDVKAVYMAPIKALCSQCFESWRKKFGPLGLTCKELTGDTAIDDFFEIQDSHIILTTPEKWDSMTRKWKDNCILQMVRLFLIDEVHVVKDATRGATLEVVVSRMKAVHAYRTAQNPETGLSMRFVAVSATIPNTSDIADWLSDESGPATYLDMDESYRPVKLRTVVLGFPPTPNQTEFKFDLLLNYKMANIIQTYSDQKPALVFCSTRKGVQQAATVLAKDARFMMSIEHKQRLMKYANSILDSKLRVTTRTLAMGVNLPAHLVVIKSTMQYVAGSCEEYSESDLLQMIGRAGRPQFDTSATAVIMTKIQTKDKYMKLMNGVEIIESSLHSHLVEHLNAEIVLQTIRDVNMALDWIRSTFLYIRALKNPTHYGFPANLDRYGIEAKLQELCLKNLNSLSSIGLIDMDEEINIKPTEGGRLMARYCVAFDTMTQFSKATGTESLSDLIELVSKSREFSDIQLRMNEKRSLNTFNRDKNRITIRFPIQGKIKTSQMKVNCLIQAQLGSISIQEFGLTQDTAKIFRNGIRISKCLSEFLSHRSQIGFSAVLNSLILAKCFRAKLWENSFYVSKQLEKIGQTLSTAMVNAGLTTFNKIEQINARELELILNRHPPFGNQIKESATNLPKYEVTLEQLPRYSCATAEIVVKVKLKNQAQLLSRRTAPDDHYISLIIGNPDNAVVFLHKLTDLVLLKGGSWSKKIEVAKPSQGEEISVNLISSQYVGLDIQQKFNVYYSGARRFGNEILSNTAFDLTGQRPLHAALKPHSSDQAAGHRENATSATDQDLGNKRQCNHYCKNKDLCGHDCCKVGVAVARRRLANQESSFSYYLNDLRNRCDTLSQTPVKRLKVKMSEESVSVDMQEFAYKPKERLPTASWYEGSHWGASVVPHVDIVDLTGDQKEPYIVHPNLVDDYEDYVEDTTGRMKDRVQAAVASHAQHQFIDKNSSSEWMNRGVSVCHNQKPLLSRIQTTSLAAVTNQGTHASSPQIPTVSFDLGNEWDDFDDENLVHASEVPTAWCLTGAQPDVHQCVGYKLPGFAGSPAPVLLDHSQAKPCVTTGRTPLRSVLPEVRDRGPSLVRSLNRSTFGSNEKISRPFREEMPVKAPEAHVVPLPRGFDFFPTESILSNTSSTVSGSNKCKEEEAFLGIFDGIF